MEKIYVEPLLVEVTFVTERERRLGTYWWELIDDDRREAF